MKLTRNEEMIYAAKRINLEITEISYGDLDPEWNIENLCAAFTRVYFPLEGEAILTFGDTTVPLLPGNIYIVPSGTNFSGFCPKSLQKIYVHLTLTRPDGSDLFFGLNRCVILTHREETIAEAAALYRQGDIPSILKFKLLLHRLLDDALTLCPPKHCELREYSELTKAALAYIDSHLSAALTISEIAAALFVSKPVLQKCFREDLDKPMGRYIDDTLLAHAERDLLDPTLSIKEISDRLGYCDQFYFSRKFTEAHGMSPKRFRQLHQG